MKKVFLIKSLRDLAALKAKCICSEEKPYFKQFLEVFEKKLVDDLIQEAIDKENQAIISPVIKRFAEKYTDIPVPFDLYGSPVNQIRVTGESYYMRCEASLNGENWHYMNDSDMLRLYMALDEAGYLNNFE